MTVTIGLAKLVSDNGGSLELYMAGREVVVVVSGFFCGTGKKVPQYVEVAKQNHAAYCEANGYIYRFYSDYDELLPSVDGSNFYRGCNSKPWHLERALREHRNVSVVMWIDIDSLFMNNKRVEEILEENKSVYVAGDCSDYANSGHFIIRNNESGLKILKTWRRLMDVRFSEEERWLCRFSLTSDGYIEGDQTALVATLGGAVENGKDIREAFNRLNLYAGNDFRYFKNKNKANALSSDGLRVGQRIVDKYWKGEVRLMTQRAMNSYVIGPVRGLYRKGDWLIHFVGDTRELITRERFWVDSRTAPNGKTIGRWIVLYMIRRKIKELVRRFYR